MKTQTINGVPFSVVDGKLHIYSSNIQIGTVDGEQVNLKDGWKDLGDVNTFLKEYRNTLKATTTAALAKAAELQK